VFPHVFAACITFIAQFIQHVSNATPTLCNI